METKHNENLNNKVKDLAILGTKATLATLPFCGGVAELFGWAVEGRFVEKRLRKIEGILEDDAGRFLECLENLNEHEYYSIRRLLKFHCFEAMPELTDTTAKAIIDYAFNRQNRVGDDQIIEILCQLNASDIVALKAIKTAIVEKGNGDYSKVVEWKDVSPFRISDPDGKFKMSDILAAVFESEDGRDITEQAEGLNAFAISFDKLHRLKVINAYHKIYSGLNTDFDIDQFIITPFGVKILSFIELGEKEGPTND